MRFAISPNNQMYRNGYDGRIIRVVKKGEKFTVYGTKHFGKDFINGYRVFYGAGYYNGYLRTSDFKKCK